jgi:hypothetical protein
MLDYDAGDVDGAVDGSCSGGILLAAEVENASGS